MHLTAARSPFQALPGELRNFIYSLVIEDKQFRVLRKPVGRRQSRPAAAAAAADQTRHSHLWHSGYGLTQTCHSMRLEFLPVYRAAVLDNVLPQDVYEYMDVFARGVCGATRDDQIVNSVLIDFSANISSILDIKPLLRLLRVAKDLHVGTYDIIEPEGVKLGGHHIPVPDLRDILTDLYDIVSWATFYDYVETAMTMVEVECDDTKGVEIVFELGADYWEDWMGVWSKPQDDPDSRIGIPLEMAEKVVQWGSGCGMELNRAEGSHLTVNFRRGPRVEPSLGAELG